MASERTGRACSVLVVITFGLAGFRSVFSFFVEHRLGNHVFFRGPVSEVEQAAAVAAKREVRVDCGVHRLAADWALVFHAWYCMPDFTATLPSVRFAGSP